MVFSRVGFALLVCFCVMISATETLILMPSTADLERLASHLLAVDRKCAIGTRQILRDTLADKLWYTVPKWNEIGYPRLHLGNKKMVENVCAEGLTCLRAIGYRQVGNHIVYPEGSDANAGFSLLGILNQLDSRSKVRWTTLQP